MNTQPRTIYPPDHGKNSDRAVNTLKNLVGQSKKVLMSIKSVFPFDLFPDEIVLDELKVTIHHHLFFFSRQLYSVEYEDIFNVSVEHNIFSATFTIEDRFFVQRPITIKYLRRNEAIQARRVIQGMILAKREKVDFSSIQNTDELLTLVEKIGKAN